MSRKKNMRRLNTLVTSQTMYNLQRLADMDGNRIRQIHGYHNDTLPGSQNPRVVHRTFLNTWLRWLESGSKRNEDGTPKLPKRKKAVEHEGEARTA